MVGIPGSFRGPAHFQVRTAVSFREGNAIFYTVCYLSGGNIFVFFFKQVVEAWPCCERLKGCNFNRMLERNSFTGMRWGSKKVGKLYITPSLKTNGGYLKHSGGGLEDGLFFFSNGRCCVNFLGVL